jgi:uncharacterized protein with ParB-like and HNH nuclease domain
MPMQEYTVNQHPIQTTLTWIESGEIATPEIQRPFVWGSTKVRDLIDSLFSGYLVGYPIAWRNPAVRLKDVSSSGGDKVSLAVNNQFMNQLILSTNHGFIKHASTFTGKFIKSRY